MENRYSHRSEAPPNRSWRFIKEFSSLLLAFTIAILVIQFGFQSYQVFGQSMEPTLQEGNYLIISKLGPTFAHLQNQEYAPQRGDIVVLESPYSRHRLIKRVIGLPEDKVVIESGEVKIVNSENPHGFDPYEMLGLPARFTDGSLITTVPKDHVFVIGDNRQAGNSSDSRNELGPVSTSNIIGKLIFRLWPLSATETY